MESTDNRITHYWSRSPGKFVNKSTGAVFAPVGGTSRIGPTFTGTVREWYEILTEVIADVYQEGCDTGRYSNRVSSTIYVGPEVLTILECSVMYRPTIDLSTTTHCVECNKKLDVSNKIHGVISNRFNVMVNYDMPKNEVLIEDFGRVHILDMRII